MGAKIISKFNGKVYKEKLIQVDFNNIEKNVTIELELKGIRSQTNIFWEIYSNGEQLDAGDLTRGQNVELVLYKAYAGSIDKPHNFEIFAKDGEGNLFDTLQLSIFVLNANNWTLFSN